MIAAQCIWFFFSLGLNLYNLNRNKWKWSNTKDDENFHQCVLTRLFKALMERKEDKQEEKDGFENALKHLALLVITNSRDEQCESDLIEGKWYAKKKKKKNNCN